MTQKECKYTPNGGPARKCQTCQHCIAPNYTQCAIIEGPIDPNGWCKQHRNIVANFPVGPL